VHWRGQSSSLYDQILSFKGVLAEIIAIISDAGLFHASLELFYINDEKW
jgi:hypothetical protein